jgi:hypothetical protein
MVRRLALVGSLCLVIAACSVNGPKYEDIQSSIPALSPGQGRIFFYRNGAIAGGLVRPEIRLNDEPVGHSAPGGFFFVDRPPGHYVVAATTETEVSLSLRLEAGHTLYVRSYVEVGILVGHPRFEIVTQEQWEGDLPQLSYAGDNISAGALPSAAPQESTTPEETSAEKARMEDLRGLLPQSR